jgi:hypothetical protein
MTSALVGGEWSASRPGRFTPWERAPGIHWIGGWVDPRTVWRRENSLPYWESNSDPSIVQPVASRYTDCVIPAPMNFTGGIVNGYEYIEQLEYEA